MLLTQIVGKEMMIAIWYQQVLVYFLHIYNEEMMTHGDTIISVRLGRNLLLTSNSKGFSFFFFTNKREGLSMLLT